MLHRDQQQRPDRRGGPVLGIGKVWLELLGQLRKVQQPFKPAGKAVRWHHHFQCDRVLFPSLHFSTPMPPFYHPSANLYISILICLDLGVLTKW